MRWGWMGRGGEAWDEVGRGEHSWAAGGQGQEVDAVRSGRGGKDLDKAIPMPLI